MEAASGRPLGRRTQPSLELSHFVRTLAPEGVVGPSLMPSHTLTLTSAFGLTNAGVRPSVRVLLRSFPRYYNPPRTPAAHRSTLGLIQFRGHFLKGGYDVHNGKDNAAPATPPGV